MSVRAFVLSACTGLLLTALSSAAALAAADPGASGCQPQQGQITATVAKTGQLGQIISQLAPINQLNPQSLFNCPNPQP